MPPPTGRPAPCSLGTLLRVDYEPPLPYCRFATTTSLFLIIGDGTSVTLIFNQEESMLQQVDSWLIWVQESPKERACCVPLF